MPKKANKTKKAIYKLLVGTHISSPGEQVSASKIAVYLGVSRQYVSKTIKEFEKHHIIKCINPKDKIKLYESTLHDFDFVYEIEDEDEKSLSTKSGPRPEMVLQKAQYTVKIERDYNDFFEKFPKHKWGNCAFRQFKTKIFDEFEEWTFRKQGKKTLIIIAPDMFFSERARDAARITVTNIVFEATKWFSKHASIKLDFRTFKNTQKPNVMVKAMSSKAKRISAQFSLNIDGKMLDTSSGHADWETTTLDHELNDAIRVMDTWESTAYLLGELDELKDRYGKINESVDGVLIGNIEERLSIVEKKQVKIVENIDTAMRSLQEIKNMILNNKPVDSVESDAVSDQHDVMFG